MSAIYYKNYLGLEQQNWPNHDTLHPACIILQWRKRASPSSPNSLASTWQPENLEYLIWSSALECEMWLWSSSHERWTRDQPQLWRHIRKRFHFLRPPCTRNDERFPNLWPHLWRNQLKCFVLSLLIRHTAGGPQSEHFPTDKNVNSLLLLVLKLNCLIFFTYFTRSGELSIFSWGRKSYSNIFINLFIVISRYSSKDSSPIERPKRGSLASVFHTWC